ncbi:FAD-binding oxidoreductase [Isoptericola sp. NPDC019482]|uniref:FAD-binding oxidoreductase n=1 Tax=Isoptericola sp. NPDC019482 TaxID=3154688 RepID=UPI0034958ABA
MLREPDVPALEHALDGAGVLREAGARDTIGGVLPQFVVRPGSVAAVAAVVREAARQDLVTVPRGGGTALGWGAPPERVDLVLDTTGLDRLIEHEAGDLVVVAQAGLSVSELTDRVGTADQELVLDLPPDRVAAGSTIGGALSVGYTGPRRLQRLALRDRVLGTTVVLADGTVARSGGKVVKNVAGYDLAKLMTGAYGTLGVVVQAAFRLHPVRPGRAVVTRNGTMVDVAAAARAVVASQLAPAAVELDRGAGRDEATLAVLFEGIQDAVQGRARAAATLVGGEIEDELPEWWAGVPAGAVTAKATATLTGVGSLLAAARDAEQVGGVGVAVRGSAMGALLVGIEAPDPATAAATVARLRAASPTPADGTVTVLAAPADVRAGLDVWGPVPGLDLMRSIKARLDPGRRLSPGRFVGGI